MKTWQSIDGGITAPQGYRAAGVHAGIKRKAPDLALIVSDRDATVAGTFTTNRIQGAVVKLCRARLAGGIARAIVVNSGNANACVGPQGMQDAARMGAVAAELLGLDEDKVFVSSTGVIGVRLPMDAVESGIATAVAQLDENGGLAAARAIMTTDTVEKELAVELSVDGKVVRIAGICKGAGMIEPNMATMLCFITTDAAVERGALQSCLSEAVAASFNRISVDGDQSCNDTVLILANGAAGNSELNDAHPDWHAFKAAVAELTLGLAHKIVEDGEGATKFVTVKIKGAVSDADARLAARQVANSLLVKTSWYGCDPNWGRVIDAVGHSGAEVEEERVAIYYDEFCSVKDGRVAAATALQDLEAVLRKDRFTLTVDLQLGDGADTVYTCDCSEEYVRINSEYTT